MIRVTKQRIIVNREQQQPQQQCVPPFHPMMSKWMSSQVHRPTMSQQLQMPTTILRQQPHQVILRQFHNNKIHHFGAFSPHQCLISLDHRQQRHQQQQQQQQQLMNRVLVARKMVVVLVLHQNRYESKNRNE